MNANELADELDWMTPEKLSWWCNAVQNMLRQQQAEIEAFEKLVSEMKYEKSSGVYDINNEPVTYLKKDESTGLYYECDKEYGFPVYTHPAEITDDGDAFRLAVRLKIEVYHGYDEGDAVYAGYYTPSDAGVKYCIEYYDDITHMGDACSATRRAIVRAATEIEKTNPLRKASEK